MGHVRNNHVPLSLLPAGAAVRAAGANWPLGPRAAVRPTDRTPPAPPHVGIVRRSLFRRPAQRSLGGRKILVGDSARRANSISAAHAMPRGPARPGPEPLSRSPCPGRPVAVRPYSSEPGPARPALSRSGNHALRRTPVALPRRSIHLEETCNDEAAAAAWGSSRTPICRLGRWARRLKYYLRKSMPRSTPSPGTLLLLLLLALRGLRDCD